MLYAGSLPHWREVRNVRSPIRIAAIGAVLVLVSFVSSALRCAAGSNVRDR